MTSVSSSPHEQLQAFYLLNTSIFRVCLIKLFLFLGFFSRFDAEWKTGSSLGTVHCNGCCAAEGFVNFMLMVTWF